MKKQTTSFSFPNLNYPKYRCITFIILVSFLFSKNSYGQNFGHLEICRYGETEVKFDLPNFYYQFSFFTNNGEFITEVSEEAVNGKLTFTIRFPENVIKGYYYMSGPDGNQLGGEFTVVSCHDELVYDTTCSEYVLGGELSQNEPVLAKTVCVGDTTYFSVVNSDPNKSNPHLPFTLDRCFFIYDLGKVVFYDSISFKVVWQKSGVVLLYFGEYLNVGQHFVHSNHYFNVKDSSKIILNNLSGSNEICLNETLNFEINSNNNINPIWEISDGRVLKGFSNQIDFHKPGDYTIKIFDDSKCNCTPPTEYHVKVNTGSSPKIVCKRTVCVGETVTYYSTDECDTYVWNISSEGSIIEGGGINDFYITVQWNNGPIGEVTLATPSCISDVCDELTKEPIYIITPTLSIIGQDTVCPNAISKYSIPDFTGTNFNWNVSNNGTILQGQNSNTVFVQWIYGGKGKVSVAYDNCNTGCNGSAELNVDILPEFELYPQNIFCFNSELDFRIYGYNADFIVTYPDGSNQNFSNVNIIKFNADQIGNYTIIAKNINNNTCNKTLAYNFEIKESIPIPTDIEGSTFTCINRPSTYSIPNLLPTQNVRWLVIENGSSKKIESKTLNYTWTSNGPYKIEATVFDPFTGCESLPYEKEFFNDLKLMGSDTVCLFSTETYKLDNYNGVDFNGYLIPINGNYTLINSEPDSLSVIWNSLGKYTINANACGVNVTKDIVVIDNPSYTLNFVDNICYESTSLLNVTSYNGEKFTLTYEDDTKDEIYLPKYVAAGKYALSYKNNHGCEFYKKFTINEREKVDLSISLRNDFDVCKPFDPYYIKAIVLPGTYTYEWYKNSTSLGITNSFINANDYGVYHVVATDIHGCNSKSDSLILNEYCPVISGGGSGLPGGGFPLIPKISGCKDLTFELLPPFDTIDVHWYVGSTKIGTGTKITYTFDKVGKFKVFVSKCELSFDSKGNPTAKCTTKEIEVTISFIPEFEIKPGCINTPTAFLNKTQALYPHTVSYLWNFGDAASGANNTSILEYPTHIYTNPGKYNISLTVTDTSGCAITVAKELEIYPIIDLKINSDSLACFGTEINFSVSAPNANYKYDWDFGDENSYADNYSNVLSPSHIFSGLGNYTIVLSAYDDRGCTYFTTKEITITSIVENVDIRSSSNNKCPGDTLTLSTYYPYYKYKWNSGETTPTIKVVDPGKYIVTVYNEAGCLKESFDEIIEDHYIVNTTVFAQEREFSRTIHFDSITICQGDSFDLKCTEVAGGTYTWSNGYFGSNVLKYESNFKNLNPGRYEYHVNVENSECEYTTDKFVVIVQGLPNKPIISSNTNNCENQETILTIDNYDNTNTYKWNNGDKDESTSVYSSGKYQVVVTNEFGCLSLSDEVIIHPIPKVNGWMTGCMDVCFPKEFCLNLPSENTYHLIHDGDDNGIFTISSGVSNFTEPGDYQIEASNLYGCKTITDILTLTAIPVDQSLSGIVYLDVNNNNFFDSIDIKIEDGRLWLMNGNTIIDETKTDTSGYYIFDSLTQNNLKVVLDPTSVSFDIKEKWDSILIYQTCVEDKVINFPLIKICVPSIENKSYTICKGGSIVLNGKKYESSTIDSIKLLNQEGCDSIIMIEINEYPLSNAEIIMKPACENTSNGSAEVNAMNNEVLTFAIDGLNFNQRNYFENLAEGMHNIYYKNQYGCIDSIEFYIEELPKPPIDIETISTCYNDDNGKLKIEKYGNEELVFKINNDDEFDSELEYNNLRDGNYTLTYKDENNCIYEMDFEIVAFQRTVLNIETKKSCFNENTGSLEIVFPNSNMLQISLNDKNNFLEESSINYLPADDYTLYYKDENGCSDSLLFKIEEYLRPQFELEAVNSCENENKGAIKIATSDQLAFSINNAAYISTTEIKNLEAGLYILSIKTKNDCVLDTTYSIIPFPIPNATATSINSCITNNTGEIKLETTSNIETSIDGINWSNNKIYENLKPGNYTIQVRNEYDCEITLAEEIATFPPLEVEMPMLDLDCYDEAVTIEPIVKSNHGDILYSWSDGSNSKTMLVDQSGTYKVIVSDECDTRSFEIELDIDIYKEEEVVFAANIFYPDSDKENRCFKPSLNNKYKVIEYLFSIYDRWGNLVFTTHSLDNCWDGKLNSENAEQDVYVYIIDAVIERCKGVSSVRKIGDVTLVR